MPTGNLAHSPAQIVAQLLIDLGVGTLPTSNGAWPAYDTGLPDEPDNAICVYDTTGEMQGRMMIGGEWEERYGINLRLRTTDLQTGVTKSNSMTRTLDTTVLNTVVAMTSPAATYLVQNMSRRSGPFDNGPEPTSGRRIFTVNYLASLSRIT